MKNEPISEFLKQYSNHSTIICYRAQLKKFFQIVNKDSSDYFKNGKKVEYYEKVINTWWDTYRTYPPKSRSQGLACIKMFHMEHGVEFKELFWRKLRRRAQGKGAITQDKIPTPEELKEILQHSKSITSKAIFMTLATSGMRIGELLGLTFDNINLNTTPARINIPSHLTKNGEKRITFITEETKGVLKEYIEHYREKYIKISSSKTLKHLKKGKDDRIFPMTYNTANTMWQTMVKNAGKGEQDKITRIHKYHIHCLRKFFRSRMGNKNGIGVDMTEFLMGHEGYLTREYRNYSEEELAEEYMKGVDRILIFEQPADTKDIREQLQQKEQRIIELEKQIEEINKKLDQGVNVYLFDQLQKLKNSK
jgi:integrase